MNPFTRSAQQEERLAKVSELYLNCLSMRQIAQELKISLATVFRDLRKAHELWRSRTTDAHEKWIQRELSTIDWTEIEASRAWQRSIGVSKTITKHDETSGDKANKYITEKNEKLAGDPRFLQIVLDCVKRRSDLLGLDEPKKVDLSGEIDFAAARDHVMRELAGIAERTGVDQGNKQPDATTGTGSTL